MPKPTKIEHVETLLWNRWLLIRIHCEDGTVGIGEGGVHGWQRPTKTMVEVMTPYLLGKDPHHIEHHYQFLYPEFEEPRHTSASSRQGNKENQGELRLFCHQT